MEREGAERKAGKGMPELSGPETVDGIKAFCPAVIPSIAGRESSSVCCLPQDNCKFVQT